MIGSVYKQMELHCMRRTECSEAGPEGTGPRSTPTNARSAFGHALIQFLTQNE